MSWGNKDDIFNDTVDKGIDHTVQKFMETYTLDNKFSVFHNIRTKIRI